MGSRSFVSAALALSAIVGVAASCSEDAPTPQPCTNVPEGGCPLSHGVACADPECAATYACREGNVWELVQTCPAHEAGGVPDAFVPEAQAPFDASVDAPPGAFGGPGCPSLEPPDCMLGTALSCPSGCCDCEDLFVCDDGGWDLWGTCGDAGPQPHGR